MTLQAVFRTCRIVDITRIQAGWCLLTAGGSNGHLLCPSPPRHFVPHTLNSPSRSCARIATIVQQIIWIVYKKQQLRVSTKHTCCTLGSQAILKESIRDAYEVRHLE